MGYTSILAVIAISNFIPPLVSAIFATLAISKSVKLLDYNSVPSTFGAMFFYLITRILAGYHGCLC